MGTDIYLDEPGEEQSWVAVGKWHSVEGEKYVGEGEVIGAFNTENYEPGDTIRFDSQALTGLDEEEDK